MFAAHLHAQRPTSPRRDAPCAQTSAVCCVWVPPHTCLPSPRVFPWGLSSSAIKSLLRSASVQESSDLIRASLFEKWCVRLKLSERYWLMWGRRPGGVLHVGILRVFFVFMFNWSTADKLMRPERKGPLRNNPHLSHVKPRSRLPVYVLSRPPPPPPPLRLNSLNPCDTSRAESVIVDFQF